MSRGLDVPQTRESEIVTPDGIDNAHCRYDITGTDPRVVRWGFHRFQFLVKWCRQTKFCSRQPLQHPSIGETHCTSTLLLLHDSAGASELDNHIYALMQAKTSYVVNRAQHSLN